MDDFSVLISVWCSHRVSCWAGGRKDRCEKLVRPHSKPDAAGVGRVVDPAGIYELVNDIVFCGCAIFEA